NGPTPATRCRPPRSPAPGAPQAWRWRWSAGGLSSAVADQLEQAPVRIVEVHARSLPARALARHRPLDHLDAVRAQVLERRLSRSRPHEAEVAAACRRW